jgi:hypothetical protein
MSPAAVTVANGSIETAHAPADSAGQALEMLQRKAGPGRYSLVVLFMSPGTSLDATARAAAKTFPGVAVVGCTTAGEISSDGYTECEIVAVGFRASRFEVRTALFNGLHTFDPQGVGERAVRMRAELAGVRPGWANEFAFLMIDGLSRREDQLVAALRLGLGGVPLFGGSAGDGLEFRRTFVLADGALHSDAAVLTLIRSSCPVRVFKIDHLIPSGVRMVVTDADPERRLVREINAAPAAREYARLVGKDPEQLSPFIFASHPVVVRIGDHHHVRAIQKVEENGDLRFFSAIDEGLVLTLAEAGDITGHLEEALADLAGDRAPEAIIGCDCILRRLEAEQMQSLRAMSRILSRHNVVGFSTYGEQFNSMHVSQTLTGVAIYPPAGPSSGWDGP